MKKFISLTLLLVVNLVFSQTGCIEIEVKDSIHLKPVNIEYEIKISQNKFVNYQSSKETKDSTKIKMREKLEDLRKFLESKNYKIRDLNNEKYQIHDYAGFWDLGYAVTLSKSEEVETLTKELKKFDFITGNVGSIEFNDNDDLWEQRLFEKLISKAKLKAKMISKLTGQQIGKIIEVKEGGFKEDFMLNLKDIYFIQGNNSSWNLEKNMIFGNRWKTAVFKFETK